MFVVFAQSMVNILGGYQNWSKQFRPRFRLE
jgi:hypothetical protein